MSDLFSPIELRGLTVHNRIAVSPMCQYVAEDGLANAWHLMHLGGLASSGAGLLFIESTAVEEQGRITPGDLGLWDEVTEASFVPVFAALRKYFRVGIIHQLGHAGRKASSEVPWKGGQLIPLSAGGWTTLAPSPLAHKEGEPAPLALDKEGLARVRVAFAAAAARSMRLGADGIELHFGHGYLAHQFLSPIANRRTDRYGGSLANRMRFPLEIFDAVRAVVALDRPVGVKVSATDWLDGGWDLEQTIEFAVALKEHGVDWVTLSSGGISPLQRIAVGPNYQVPFAKAVKRATGLTTIAVGLVTQATQAQAIVANGDADMVALARAMLYDSRWGWHAAAELGATIDGVAPPYWRAPPQGRGDLFRGTVHGAR